MAKVGSQNLKISIVIVNIWNQGRKRVLSCPSEKFIYGRYWKSPMQDFMRHVGF